MNHWYAAYTRPAYELKAQKHLAFQQFETYLPIFRKKYIWRGRIEHESRPLFPRYIFIQMDTERDRWRNILTTIGIISLVLSGDSPAPISVNIIEAIKASITMTITVAITV